MCFFAPSLCGISEEQRAQQAALKSFLMSLNFSKIKENTGSLFAYSFNLTWQVSLFNCHS